MSDNANETESPLPERKNQGVGIKAFFLNSDSFINDNRVTGVWHTFPTTKEEIQAMFKEIGIDGVKHDKYTIYGYKSNINSLDTSLPEKADIDELNFLAVKLLCMDEQNLDKFSAVMETGEFKGNLTKIINASMNLDSYELQPASDAEQYGEFLIDMYGDALWKTIEKLKESSDPDENKLVDYIELLEKHFNVEDYGFEVAAAENGKYTENGYLTKENDLAVMYKGIEDIPDGYKVFAFPNSERPVGLFKIENTDLTDFVYKLHIYGGNLINQAANNIPLLSDGDNRDFIVHLRHTEVKITGSETAYHDNSEAGSLIKLTSGHTKSFMLHIDSMENNRAFGSVVLTDCTALAEDIDKNTISYINVTANLKDGSTQEYTREQWENLILIERHNVDSQTFNFNSDDVLKLRNHRQELFGRCLQEATEITSNALLDMLNANYMALADQPQSGMVRIPLETAKNMLLYSDANVYRLMPHKPEQLSALTAAKGGLMFPQYRDFGVKCNDRSGIDKMCNREINKLFNNTVEQTADKKHTKTEHEH